MPEEATPNPSTPAPEQPYAAPAVPMTPGSFVNPQPQPVVSDAYSPQPAVVDAYTQPQAAFLPQPQMQPQFQPQPAAAMPGAYPQPPAQFQPPQPFGPMPQGIPMAPPQAYTPPKAKNKALLPLIIAGGVVVVLIIAAGAVYVLSNRITSKDVTTAQKASNAISDDMDALDNSASSIESADTTAEFNSKIGTISDKLADAEKQYAILKTSKVQHDKTTHAKFQAVDAKWGTFTGYISDNIADLKVIQPVMLKFETDITDLSSNPPTTVAGLNTYLASYKNIIDTGSNKVSSLHMKIDENTQLLTAFQTAMHSMSASVALAQSDLSAGKDGFTVEDDLLQVEDAETAFTSSLTSIDEKVTTHEDQVDVTTQFNDFATALNDLYGKVTKY